MGINYALLRNLTARKMMSALVRDGFAVERGDGSHQIFYHLDGRRVAVIFQVAGRTFTRKTLKSMIEQACWTEDSAGSRAVNKASPPGALRRGSLHNKSLSEVAVRASPFKDRYR